MIPVSTQRYKDGGAIDKSVLYITDSLRHQKLGLTTSWSRGVQGIFVVELRAQKFDRHFFNTQLSLNEDGNDLDKKIELYELQEKVRKLYDSGW